MAYRSERLSFCYRLFRSKATVFALLMVLLSYAAESEAAAPSGDGWSSLQAESLSIYFREDDSGLAQAIADIGPSTIDYISMATGTPIPEHIDVVLAGDAQSFASLQPSPPPSWAVGTAWPKRKEIYLRTRLPHVGPDPIQRTFTHELCHIMVGSVFESGRPPRWLQEGVAMLFAGEMRPSDQAALVRAAVGKTLLPLSEITTRWPRSSRHAHLAYLQATDFVAFLSRQGDGVLASVIEQLAGGAELSEAVASSTGRPLSELESEWRNRLSIWHAIVPIIGGPNAFWGFACVLFLVAAWKRRQQKKAQLLALEERELQALQGAKDATPPLW